MGARDDGVVKYRADHTTAPLPRINGLAQLDTVRTRLWDLGWLGVYPDGIGYGNVSLRHERDTFVISGSGTGAKRFLEHTDYALVESFDPEANQVVSSGQSVPSSESMTHGAIYRADTTVRCVLHIHHRGWFDRLLSKGWPRTPAEVPYGTPEMSESVAELVRFRSRRPFLFVSAGHEEGLFAFGSTLESTLDLMFATLKGNP
jgi:Class II Aldolase and Adducin N-terminal domain